MWISKKRFEKLVHLEEKVHELCKDMAEIRELSIAMKKYNMLDITEVTGKIRRIKIKDALSEVINHLGLEVIPEAACKLVKVDKRKKK